MQLQVEFEAPVGYKEPIAPRRDIHPEATTEDTVIEEVVETFKGAGVRLDGKQKKESQLEAPVTKKVSYLVYQKRQNLFIYFFIHRSYHEVSPITITNLVT